MRIYWTPIVTKYQCCYVSFSIYVEVMSAFGLGNFCSVTKRITLNEPEESHIAPGTYIQNNYPPSQLRVEKNQA